MSLSRTELRERIVREFGAHNAEYVYIYSVIKEAVSCWVQTSVDI